jgi:predicted protein tyrosine phosphatase
MAQLVISGIYDLADKIAQHRPDLVISITDPDADEQSRAKRELSGHDGRVLHLAFHDIDQLERDHVAPNPSHLRKVSAALDMQFPGGEGTVLVHCSAGFSRSPAIGLFALGHLARGRAAPYDVFDRWKAATGSCEPNRRILMMLGSELGSMGRQLAELAILDVQKTKMASRRIDTGSLF